MPDAAPRLNGHYVDINDGKFAGTTRDDLRQLFAKLAADPPDKLVVHFHGGNVSRQEGLKIADELLDVYRKAGAYPVFFVWNSAISESLEAARANFRQALKQSVAGLFRLSTYRNLLRPEPRGLPYRMWFMLLRIGHTFYRIIRRFVTGRSHGFRATIAEEFLRAFFVADFGYAVWYLMTHEIVNAFGDDESCGGTAFLLELKELLEVQPRLRIILVAHSGGSIYACHFIRNAKKHGLDTQFDVIFLAAAVTVELFSETIEQHGSSIRKFRSFALKDEWERRDPLVPDAALVRLLYPRSLLYFMSGVCEPGRDDNDVGDVPLVGMQRYWNDGRAYRRRDIEHVRGFLSQERFAVWSVEDTAADGLACATQTHIGFDEDDRTRRSIAHIIKNDF